MHACRRGQPKRQHIAGSIGWFTVLARTRYYHCKYVRADHVLLHGSSLAVWCTARSGASHGTAASLAASSRCCSVPCTVQCMRGPPPTLLAGSIARQKCLHIRADMLLA
ncbi:unnamed protein product [Triticum turgidum subsp. durum]|uniref:Uncharacterized protein n=1 Tax=Triticum turgidum subsp. durum TaxID=4567 RepID=A0A9R0S3F5_TRITD|nr:unnamed protein product [Triticum turgidum subsp. durum]